jgi:hypothetical protein
MGAMEAVAARVRAGGVVTFRPKGNSMRPLINSGNEVVVAPLADPARLEVGDIVLVRVAGHTYLHLVDAVDHDRQRVRIANNRGRVNGWAPWRQVHGICTCIDGRERRGATAKGLAAG